MGNQNATAVPEDGKIVDHSTESSGEENLSPDDKKGENQMPCKTQQTHEVSSDEVLGEASEPPDQQIQPPVNATEVTEQVTDEQERPRGEPQDQLKVNDEDTNDNEPQDDDQIMEQSNVKHNEVGLNSSISETCISHESGPSEHKQDLMDNNDTCRECTEELQTKASHAEIESNLEEDLKVQTEEDACGKENCDLFYLQCDLGTESDMVDANNHSMDTKGIFNQDNENMAELTSCHCNLDNAQFLEGGQTYTVDNNSFQRDEKVLQSTAEEPPIFRDNIPVQDDTIASDGEPRVTDIESLKEEIEDKLCAIDPPNFLSGNERETQEVQSCDQSHEDVSNAHDQEITRENGGNSDCSAKMMEVQMDEIKCVTENFPSLASNEQGSNADMYDTSAVSKEPTVSNGFDDKGELLGEDIVAQIQSKQDNCGYLVESSELHSTKPDIEGFIFTNGSANGGQPTMDYLLSDTVTNFIELPKEKGRENFSDEVKLEHQNAESQVERCPSFKFELKKETPQEELNQTPLLYQGKPPMRSLSTPGNIFLSTFASDENGQNFVDMSVKEKTIILDRNDSEKSRTPLLKFENEEDRNCFSTTKHRKQDEGFSNGHSKGEMMILPKGRQKHKTMSSFFSNCVCCAGVNELNADF